MAHNLEFNKQKSTYSFVSAMEIPWHNLGQIIDKKGLTSAECIKYANLDFDVTKKPLKVFLEENKYGDVPETYATVRSDTDAVLGIVKDRYEILQNRDAFSFFDEL